MRTSATKTRLKFGKKRQPAEAGNKAEAEISADDDFDDVDDVDYEDYGSEFEALRSRPAFSQRIAARRAIELAREELALKRELEDYPEH